MCLSSAYHVQNYDGSDEPGWAPDVLCFSPCFCCLAPSGIWASGTTQQWIPAFPLGPRIRSGTQWAPSLGLVDAIQTWVELIQGDNKEAWELPGWRSSLVFHARGIMLELRGVRLKVIRVLTFPLMSCVALRKFLNLSELQIPTLQKFSIESQRPTPRTAVKRREVVLVNCLWWNHWSEHGRLIFFPQGEIWGSSEGPQHVLSQNSFFFFFFF